MHILVTGGAGFIGSHVVDTYIAAGHRVIVVDNLSTGRRENLNPEAIFYEIDIRDTEVLAQVFEREQPEVVNHHAAQVDVRKSVTDPRFDAEVNVLGTLSLLEQARIHGTRKVIFISSGGAVYGEPEYVPCDEEHPIQPLSPYGASKAAVEVYLNVYRETYGIETTILRYANVYGPRQDPHGEAGVVAIFAGKMLQSGTEGSEETSESDTAPVIFGSGEQQRDFVYVGDCANANLIGLTEGAARDEGAHGVYNIGTGKGTSVNEIAALLKELMGYEGDIEHESEKPGEVFRTYLDITRAQAELEWSPKVSLREGLQRMVAYFETQRIEQ